MKTIFPLLFLLLLSVQNAKAQNNELSGSIKQLQEVDQGPFTKQCHLDPSCTLDAIRNHVVENLDESVLESKETDSVSFNLKFVIDTTGKIVWARAQGGTDNIRKEGERAIKTFPAMDPAAHEGEIVNVIGDLPIILKIVRPIKETYDPISEAYDTPAYPLKCKGKESLKECSSKTIQEFLHKRIKIPNLSQGAHWAEVSFEIDTMGKVGNIATKGNSEKLKKRVIKAVRKLPEFVPATKDGEKVSITYTFPLFVRTQKF